MPLNDLIARQEEWARMVPRKITRRWMTSTLRAARPGGLTSGFQDAKSWPSKSLASAAASPGRQGMGR